MTLREGPRPVSSNTVGTQTSQASLEARVASIDEEIRSLLTQPEPALQPFYGMMLYHLGLDAGRPRGGKRLRPLLCLLDFASLLEQSCVRVCEGQFLDISFESRTDVTAERYRVMATRKTGALFAASAQSAAMLASDDPSVREQLARFGEEFGQAFQAHDDLLGIWASTERTGKIEMNDLVKRKKTLPVVLAFERASPRVRAQLDELFAPQAPLPAENVDRIRAILADLGVRPMLEREIEEHSGRALHLLHGDAATRLPPPRHLYP